MRKVAVVVTALVAALAVSAVAFAAQVNTYTVTASGSPKKAGSHKHPVAETVNFDYTVSEEGGQRPATVQKYSIFFKGLRTNGKFFKRCTATEINNAGSDSVCSKKAKVGAGSVDNAAGASSNPADKSIPCHLTLTLYNAGQNRLALYLFGNSQQPEPCAIPISVAIPGKFVKKHGGSALEFTVPPSLLHPVPGIDNAVTRVKSQLPKKIARVHRKHHKTRRVGFFESVGGCVHNRRQVEVTFTQEDGQHATIGANPGVKCTK